MSIENKKEATIKVKDIEVNSCTDIGYVQTILQLMKQLRVDQVLDKVLSPSDALLVKAMLVGKIITGGSKLGIFNWLCREKDVCKLLGLDMKGRKVDQLYYSLGQLCLHQSKIEKKWFRYHHGNTRRVYLYDLTSTYFEGTQNAFAAYGYNRDGKKGKMSVCLLQMTVFRFVFRRFLEIRPTAARLPHKYTH